MQSDLVTPEPAFAVWRGWEQRTSCRFAVSRNQAGGRKLPADRRYTCVAASSRSPIGTEFLSSRPAERHVVAQDVIFVAIGIHDGGERFVRFARRVVVIDFDIVDLGAAD